MPPETHALMQKRAEHCNEAIKIIGNHSSGFFRSEELKRHARIEVDQAGRIYWIDDSSGVQIDTQRSDRRRRWHGFSHGGALQYLAEQLCHYARTGEQVPIWLLGPRRPFSDGNTWGYPPDEMRQVLELVEALPVFCQEQPTE